MAPVKQLSLPLESAEGESEMGNPVEPKSTFCSSLIGRVVDRNNLLRALKQVRRNKVSVTTTPHSQRFSDAIAYPF